MAKQKNIIEAGSFGNNLLIVPSASNVVKVHVGRFSLELSENRGELHIRADQMEDLVFQTRKYDISEEDNKPEITDQIVIRKTISSKFSDREKSIEERTGMYCKEFSEDYSAWVHADEYPKED